MVRNKKDWVSLMPDQIEYQRAAYDDHYPQMAKAVRQQVMHPLLSSFYDRLAGVVLDGLPAGAGAGPHRLLEAGCGEGLLAAAFHRVAAARGLALAYTGTDLSVAGLDIAAVWSTARTSMATRSRSSPAWRGPART